MSSRKIEIKSPKNQTKDRRRPNLMEKLLNLKTPIIFFTLAQDPNLQAKRKIYLLFIERSLLLVRTMKTAISSHKQA